MNTDFWGVFEVIQQWFLWVMKICVKIIATSPHESQKKTVFMVTHIVFYFLHTILCPAGAQKPAKTIIICSFRHFARDGLFWLGIVMSLQFILWRHMNARYWHSDGISNDCSCALKLMQMWCKLVQMWSSLVNNDHEYWFPTKWYSPFSV